MASDPEFPDMQMEVKLRNTLRENLELKKMLEHNNAAMKQQFATLQTWQEQMRNVHDEHRQKFEAAKELVMKLKHENQQLKDNARKFEINVQKGTPPISTLNSQDKSTSASQTPKASQTAECIAHISVEEAKSAMHFEQEKTMRVQLEQTVLQLRDEMEKMKLTIENNQQMKNPDLSLLMGETTPRSMSPSMSWDSSDVLYESNGCAVMNSPAKHKVHHQQNQQENNQQPKLTNDDQNQILHLTQLLTEERNRAALLQKKLESKTSKSREQLAASSSSIDVQSQQLIRELKISEEKFNTANNCLQSYKDKCDSLDKWLKVYQGKLESLRTKDNNTIEKLRAELENMRALLKTEQQAKMDDQKNLMDARQQLEKVMMDYQLMMKSWEGFRRDQENKDRQLEAWSEIQHRQMQEKLDRLTAKLVTSEDARAHLVQDISNMKALCERHQHEVESIPILKSQIDFYKENFEKEKESKQKLVQSMSRLQDEISVLRSQNLQLLDEINAYNEMATQVTGDNNNVVTSSRQFTVPAQVGNTQGQDAPAQSSSFLPSNVRECRSIRLSNGVETNCNFFYCPKCNVGYSNYGHLLKHVEVCINTSD